MEALFGLFTFIFFLVSVAVLTGLIRPQFLSNKISKINSRKDIAKYGGAVIGVVFIILMVLTPFIPNAEVSFYKPGSDLSEALSVDKPLIVYEATYEISGMVEPADTKLRLISRNEKKLNEEITVKDDGSFSHTLQLSEGLNEFTIQTDDFTQTKTTLSIDRHLSEEEKAELAAAEAKRAEEQARLEAEQKKQAEAAEEAERIASLGEAYNVMSVIDGDTIKARLASGGEIVSVRLIGIDTPETVHPSKPVQCFGKEASSKLTELIEGKTVYLESDASQGDSDKYNRLLRYINLKDGTSINLMMVLDGYAFEYTYNIPYRYQTEYREAEITAMKNDAGLWASDTCDGDVEIESTQTQTAPTSDTSGGTSGNTTDSSGSSSSNCDPNYTGGCVPKVSYDLDCGDISFSVWVVGTDIHGFDGDGDGHGCESN